MKKTRRKIEKYGGVWVVKSRGSWSVICHRRYLLNLCGRFKLFIRSAVISLFDFAFTHHRFDFFHPLVLQTLSFPLPPSLSIHSPLTPIQETVHVSFKRCALSLSSLLSLSRALDAKYNPVDSPDRGANRSQNRFWTGMGEKNRQSNLSHPSHSLENTPRIVLTFHRKRAYRIISFRFTWAISVLGKSCPYILFLTYWKTTVTIDDRQFLQLSCVDVVSKVSSINDH